MSEKQTATQEQLLFDKTWFIGFSLIMVIALVWDIFGESHVKIVFNAVAFILFLRAGINYEMTSRALDSHH